MGCFKRRVIRGAGLAASRFKKKKYDNFIKNVNNKDWNKVNEDLRELGV
jgi:hypothetical protein